MSEDNKHRVTLKDIPWIRKRSGNKKYATEIDPEWRNILKSEQSTSEVTINYFRTFDEFSDAITSKKEFITPNGSSYKFKERLPKEGGEAVILKCNNSDGEDLVIKVYYEPVNTPKSRLKSREKVLEYMRTAEGQQYTLPISDVGFVEYGDCRYYFEVMPFVKEGDIADAGALSFDELVNFTKQMNDALNSIHKYGILHRDIKPQNIYKINGRYVLGDFGIAKLVEKNKRIDMTGTILGSEGYTAPELRLVVSENPIFRYTDKIDYYSLGVTIGTLFEGHFVYEDINEAMIPVCIQKGRLPLRRADPHREELENLLNGLCRFQPEYRFDYDEVNKWLANHDYQGSLVNDEWPKDFVAFNKKFRDEKSLFNEITKTKDNWNEAKIALS